eukprot:GGOE01062307.1.p1 GENE.GGOE01062307.1~~GGOE01062307.1.p1  ORF type:complete len:1086 (-),score=217.74 GGOE01062307.1:459-3686(-)
MHGTRSFSQMFVKPSTPRRRPLEDKGRSPFPSAQKPLGNPSLGALANTTNMPLAARCRSVSTSSIMASPQPCRSPVTPRPSPIPTGLLEPPLTPRRRASAPATPDQLSSMMLRVPQASPHRISCPNTPTNFTHITAVTPSPCNSIVRTPSLRPNRVHVALRIRPISGADRGNVVVALVAEGDAVRVATRAPQDGGRDMGASAERIFPFDHVLVGDQQQVYDAVGAPLLCDALQGYSVCLFAYGQTGSGKTHSLQGSTQDEGVVPRMIRDLFVRQTACQVFLSLFEVYNEKLRDLLVEGPALELYEDAERRVHVRHLSRHAVHSAEATLQLIAQGTARRQVGHTMMNHQSSRSHLVLQLSLVMQEMESIVVVVDLAGSDRASKTEATGETFRESKNINHSLLMLGRTLNSMSEGHAFVPSRDCKITRLLTSHLQGNCKVTLLATVSPTAYNATESVCTMEFAQNAAAIRKVVRVNSTTSKSALALKEMRQAKEAAEQRCEELEAQVSSLQRSHDEVRQRCEELTRLDHVLENQPLPRLSMDMVVDETDARMDLPAECVAASPSPQSTVVGDAAQASLVADLHAEVSQLSEALKERTQQLETLRCDYEVVAQALQRCEELTSLLHPVENQPQTAQRLSMDMLMDDTEAKVGEATQEESCAADTATAAQLSQSAFAPESAEVSRMMGELREKTQQLETLRWDYETRHSRELQALQQRCDALQGERDALCHDRDRLEAEATAAIGAAVAAAAAPAADTDDMWLASGPASGPCSPWRPTSSLATTPRLPTAASPIPRDPSTPAICSLVPGNPPLESINISSDSDSDGVVTEVRTCPSRRRRPPSGRFSMTTRSGALRAQRERWAAEADAVDLRVGAAITVLMENLPQGSSRGTARSGRQRPAVLRCLGTVVAAHGPNTFVVHLQDPTASPSQHVRGRTTCKVPEGQRNKATPPSDAVTAKQCRDCSRRLTGFNVFAKANWAATRRRHSMLGDINRELGQQWRRLTVQAQDRYRLLAEQANCERGSPLCRGAFNRFAAEERQRVRAKNPRLSFALMQRHVSSQWKTMPYTERAKYSQHTRP